MDNSITLTLLSLTLGLIGTFTKTSRETTDGKKVTVWGYIVAGLIIVSAGITVLSSLKAKERDIADKKLQEIEINHQRLLSLLSVASNFKLAGIPHLDLEFIEKVKKNAEPVDSIESAHMRAFPGFGVEDVSYNFDLLISENKYFMKNGLGSNIKNDDIPELIFESEVLSESQMDSINTKILGSLPGNKLYFKYENFATEIDYFWYFPGYTNLIEFLLDFQPKREIGTLTLNKKGGLRPGEIEKINKYILAAKNWQVRVFLKNTYINNGGLNISIPIEIEFEGKVSDGYRYKLISGAPIMDNRQFPSP